MQRMIAAIVAFTIVSGLPTIVRAQTYLLCQPDNRYQHPLFLDATWRLGPGEIAWLDARTQTWKNFCENSGDPAHERVDASCSVTADYYRAEFHSPEAPPGLRVMTISRRTGAILYTSPGRTDQGRCEPTTPPVQVPQRF